MAVGICWVIAEEEGSTTWDTPLPTLPDHFSSSAEPRNKKAPAPGELCWSPCVGSGQRGSGSDDKPPQFIVCFRARRVALLVRHVVCSVCRGRMGSSRNIPRPGPVALLRWGSARPTATPAGRAESLHCSWTLGAKKNFFFFADMDEREGK